MNRFYIAIAILFVLGAPIRVVWLQMYYALHPEVPVPPEDSLWILIPVCSVLLVLMYPVYRYFRKTCAEIDELQAVIRRNREEAEARRNVSGN